MSKSSNSAKISCFLSWLEDFKKYKPKKQYAVQQTPVKEETVLIRNGYENNRKRK